MAQEKEVDQGRNMSTFNTEGRARNGERDLASTPLDEAEQRINNMTPLIKWGKQR